MADAMKMQRIILETDFEVLYKEIIGRKKMGCWKVQPYIADILSKKDSFIEFKCTKIRRSTNKTADWVAH